MYSMHKYRRTPTVILLYWYIYIFILAGLFHKDDTKRFSWWVQRQAIPLYHCTIVPTWACFDWTRCKDAMKLSPLQYCNFLGNFWSRCRGCCKHGNTTKTLRILPIPPNYKLFCLAFPPSTTKVPMARCCYGTASSIFPIGCPATEPGFTRVIGAIEIWLINWLID